MNSIFHLLLEIASILFFSFLVSAFSVPIGMVLYDNFSKKEKDKEIYTVALYVAMVTATIVFILTYRHS